MKAYKFGMYIVSMGLVFGIMTGCGGGGTSEVPTAVTPDTPSSVTIEDVLEKENIQATQFVSQMIAYADAVNEHSDVFEAATLGLDVEQMSVEDLINVLGEEEVNSLASQLLTIHDEKIVPSFSAADEAGNDMIASEEQIKEIVYGTSQTSVLAEGFVTNRTLKVLDGELAFEPFTMSGAACIVAGGLVLYSVVASGLTCGKAVLTEYAACRVKDKKDFPSHTNVVSHLACTLQLPYAGEECLKQMAILWTSTAGSIAATGYKALQLGIDAGSAALNTLGIYEFFATKCPTETGGFDNGLVIADDIQRKDIEPNPDATAYIGKANEEGIFIVPEGKWELVTFADGYVRQYAGCIDVSGPEEIIKHNVIMAPIDNIEDVTCDSMNIQVTIPGYTGPFVSNHTEMSFASLNDGPYIYPSFITTDANSPEEFNPFTSNDLFTMIFNTTLSAGNTYLLTEDGDGNANVRFTTPQIVDEDGAPIVFSEASGSFTLTEYGINVGDRLSGSFSCSVIGKRTEDVVINGNISGTFSGTLTAPQLDSAISKSMKISF